MHEFFSDVQGPAGAFPSYSFIEPNYFKGEQNDDHPPHSTMRAQRLLAHVYNELRKNEALWNSTLLVVLYDEHGGFYDHVPPPAAVPPDQYQDKFTFDRLGIRVPALLVSPWVDRRVISTKFDHTSLLKYLTELWKLGPLTERVRQANGFSEAFRNSPRTDTPPSVPVPPLIAVAGPLGVTDQELAEPVNENQKALLVFSKHLEVQTVISFAPGSAALEAAVPDVGPMIEFQLAKRRVLAFLNQQKAQAMIS